MKSYKLIALTGTTGAGKGEARKVFEENGFKVIDADALAREIMENPVVLKIIQTFFGGDTVKDGELDRRLLAQRAFCDKDKTKLLGELTHPFITPLLLGQIREFTRNGADKIIFDAPQLFESGLDIICDVVVTVVADENIRLKRIMKRDSLSEAEAKTRISAQLSDVFFRERGDFIIENNLTVEQLRVAAEKIIGQI